MDCKRATDGKKSKKGLSVGSFTPKALELSFPAVGFCFVWIFVVCGLELCCSGFLSVCVGKYKCRSNSQVKR